VPYSAKTIQNLSQILKSSSEVQEADAAVALLLRPTNQEFEILVVKRVENPLDPWSGQMAFPGGKRNPKDRNMMETMIREVLEETNIDLSRRCRFLGTLEKLRSNIKPELLVACFIGLLEYKPTIKLNEELVEYFWVTLDELRKCKGTAELSFGEVPAYVVRGNAIWGLTDRILDKLFDALEYSNGSVDSSAF